MTQSQEHPPKPETIRRGYELEQINMRGLMLFLIFFLLTAVVIHTGLWVLVKYYSTLTRAVDVPSSTVPLVDRYPAPNLQPTPAHNTVPVEDMRQLLKHWDSLFNQIGWNIDATTGSAVIPDRVVAELSQRYANKSNSQGTAPATAPIGTQRSARGPSTAAPTITGGGR